MTRKHNGKITRAKLLLDGLSENMEELKKGLKTRRAQEKKGAPQKPRDSQGELTPVPTPVKDTVPAEEVLEHVQEPPHALAPQEQVPATHPVGPSQEEKGSGPVVLAPPMEEPVENQAAVWLADLDFSSEEAMEVEAGGESDFSEEDGLVDRLDIEFVETAREETEELLPAIEDCLERVATHGLKKDVAELSRHVHTLKGVAGIAGAMKTRALIHRMETLMEEVQGGKVLDKALHARLSDMFMMVSRQMTALFSPSAEPEEGDGEGKGKPEQGVVAPPVIKNVRIPADTVDRLFNEINEARLAGTSLSGNTILMRRKLREMEENIGRVSRMARDLEMQAETQIQSRRAQIAESNEEFDPLEMDRFTILQELSRLLNEAVSDVQDLQRDIVRSVSDQETHLAYQERSIHEVQEGLLKTRLVSVDAALNDRLHKVALSAAKELGKSVGFVLSGGRVALDRALLEKVAPPLEHILRNAVAHGVEMPEERQAAGKPSSGLVRVAMKQEAGKVSIVVEDDGAGLNVDKIQERAVERGLWEKGEPMSDRQAIDMVCRPGFSTVDTISQIAGRGVGMDVVRSDVLAMGGRFDLDTRSGRGLRVAIQLPTTVASASVMIVEAEGETWSVPTEILEDVMVVRKGVLARAREEGVLEILGARIPFSDLGSLMGVSDAATVRQESAPIMILREGERQIAVEVQKLRQVAEVPLRPLARIWGRVPGIVGSTLLPDGRASFLVDPLRAPWAKARKDGEVLDEDSLANRPPLVLVVDDSITVRRVTAQFLERNGFEPVLAKDGQEALEVLAKIQPAAVLLDVEMPRMDGFDCAKNIRENPRHKSLPILMITSRTAPKHRERAFSLGVDEYLGKPFQEDELLELLSRHIRQSRANSPGVP